MLLSVLVSEFKALSSWLGSAAPSFPPSAFKEYLVLLPLSLSLPVEKTSVFLVGCRCERDTCSGGSGGEDRWGPAAVPTAGSRS